MSETKREERLREVERLSRKPHQELHAKLLGAVEGAMDSLTPEEWLALARKSSDRMIQALSMTGRLAGYSERSETRLEGSLDVVHALDDMTLERRIHELAQEAFQRLEQQSPLGWAIRDLKPHERKQVIEILAGATPVTLALTP